MALIIGIESTAHTFGVGVVKDGEIIANERDMYTTEEGGIIPVDSANHHRELAPLIYARALVAAGINERDVDAISFSQGPGLPPCLLAGRDFARDLAIRLEKPLVPVNHCVAHLEVGRITGATDPVLLYCSGANTQVIAYAAGKYRVFGETLDVGVGNFIDNFARYAGLGFPGGPKIEKEAVGGEYIELPYSVKGMDIALSGILTNLRQKLEKKVGKNGEDYTLKNLSYSLQETVFAMLIETAERALAHVGKTELLLGGGVACNSRLQEMTKVMCSERPRKFEVDGEVKNIGETKFFCPPRPLLVDNGAMIAYLGEIMFNAEFELKKNGHICWKKDKIEKIDIMPRQRTDQVDVTWKK
ncbi:MAG: KEOPS complex N(6)-L-threonylcarbamoyladenine synthase Kae1 [Nanoarchaeota archaeon]|jgi:glycoprotease/Kae1 family metallohydrolase|nr:KEOPS complex N(6)-L-threonylcarbamoyladenine synthase Kae1 [Nanoarchaeota archaeon]